MSLTETFEFLFRFTLGASDAATWIYVGLAILLIPLVLGSFLGKLWNKDWSLTGKFGVLIVVVICAIGTAYSIFNLRSAGKLDNWFQSQRTTLPKTLADSSRLQRLVLSSTWQQLESAGNQTGLTPPDQSGEQVRLNSPEDAVVLSSLAAEETRSTLRRYAPFTFGAPLDTISPDDVAAQTVDAVNVSATGFPRVISQANEWTATAVTIQAQHALDSAYERINDNLSDLRTASWVLLIASLLIPALLVPIRAVEDIKVNPKA